MSVQSLIQDTSFSGSNAIIGVTSTNYNELQILNVGFASVITGGGETGSFDFTKITRTWLEVTNTTNQSVTIALQSSISTDTGASFELYDYGVSSPAQPSITVPANKTILWGPIEPPGYLGIYYQAVTTNPTSGNLVVTAASKRV